MPAHQLAQPLLAVNGEQVGARRIVTLEMTAVREMRPPAVRIGAHVHQLLMTVNQHRQITLTGGIKTMRTLIFDARPQDVLIEDGHEVNGGGEITVDDDRAQQLLDQGIPLHEPTAELSRLGRKELDALANEAGVTDPEKLKTKDAVIAAINEAGEGNPVEPEADAGAGHDTTTKEA